MKSEAKTHKLFVADTGCVKHPRWGFCVPISLRWPEVPAIGHLPLFKHPKGGVTLDTKAIKLSPKRGGHGHVTSYSVNLGSAEVREAGFLDADGVPLPVEKYIDKENHAIIIQLQT